RARTARPRDLRSFPTRRSSDLGYACAAGQRQGLELLRAGLYRQQRLLVAQQAGGGFVTLAQAILRKTGKGPVGKAGQRRLDQQRSEEHTSELQSREKLVCRLLL